MALFQRSFESLRPSTFVGGLAIACCLIASTLGCETPTPERAIGQTIEQGTEQTTEWTELGESLRVRQIEADLWLHESDGVVGEQIIPANGVIIRGSAGIVIADLPWTERQTGQLLDWIEAHLDGEILGAFGSHFHADAFGGIAEVHRRGLPTWGHSSTPELAIEEGREAPKHLFDRRFVLSLGDERVEALHFGPGHSPDDIMVWLPKRRVLFAGCAVKTTSWNTLGYLGVADLEEWPVSMNAALDLDPRIVVPGHGELGGPELLRHTLALIEENRAEGQND